MPASGGNNERSPRSIEAVMGTFVSVVPKLAVQAIASVWLATMVAFSSAVIESCMKFLESFSCFFESSLLEFQESLLGNLECSLEILESSLSFLESLLEFLESSLEFSEFCVKFLETSQEISEVSAECFDSWLPEKSILLLVFCVATPDLSRDVSMFWETSDDDDASTSWESFAELSATDMSFLSLAAGSRGEVCSWQM